MQRKILFAAALAMATAIGSQATHAEDTVAVIVKATTSEYWQWVFKGAEDAGKLLGVKVEKLGTPKDDAAGEIAVLESAAASKPTAVVISPTIFEALGDPIAKVTESGIPVIVIDFGRQDGQVRLLSHHQQRGGRQSRGRCRGSLHQGAHRQGGWQGCLSHCHGGS